MHVARSPVRVGREEARLGSTNAAHIFLSRAFACPPVRPAARGKFLPAATGFFRLGGAGLDGLLLQLLHDALRYPLLTQAPAALARRSFEGIRSLLHFGN